MLLYYQTNCLSLRCLLAEVLGEFFSKGSLVFVKRELRMKDRLTTRWTYLVGIYLKQKAFQSQPLPQIYQELT